MNKVVVYRNAAFIAVLLLSACCLLLVVVQTQTQKEVAALHREVSVQGQEISVLYREKEITMARLQSLEARVLQPVK